MKSKNWKTIESIYDQAVLLKQFDQLNYVQKKSKGNEQIITQVMKMLDSQNKDFMDKFPGKLIEETLDLSFPKTLGHFEIIKKIATGGMGRVYLAQSTNADVVIKVALKTIRVELINQDLKNKFQNEKQILSRLQHKNIASLIDAGITDNNIPYIATQWIDGQNIKQYCIQQKSSLQQRLKLFLQICDAVAFAHNNLIIHRDLKPDNILVDKHNQIKLLDFGIAKIIDANQSKQTQTQVYTPDYAAPEQISGQLCTVTTDIYSLGVVLFELLTNTRRFNLSCLSIPDKINAISSPKRIDIKNLSIDKPLPYTLAKIKGPLENIINKAMHVDPARRYESVFILALDIKNYLAKKPISAIKDSFYYKAKMFLQRNKLASVLTSLIFIAITVGTFINQQQFNLKLQEAKKSEIMLDFLNEILVSASPIQGGSTNISVKEMFETGINKYDFNGIKDPYIKAELAAHTGLIYGQIGNMDKELEYTNIAIDYYKNRLTNKRNLNSFVKYSAQISSAYVDNHDYDTALSYIQTVFDKVAGLEVNPILMCKMHIYLARTYKGKQNDVKSRQHLEMAAVLAQESNSYMEIGEVNFYHYALFFDDITDQQGLVYLQKAQINFEKALQSKFNPNLHSSMSSQADLLSILGRYRESENLHVKTRNLTLETYGRDDFVGLISRAKNLIKLGDFHKSIELLKEAEEVYKNFNLSRKPAYHGLLSYTASVYVEFEKFTEAENLFKTVLAYFSGILPAEHIILKMIDNSFADMYLKANMNEKMESAEIALKGHIEADLLENNLPVDIKIIILTSLGNINLHHNDFIHAKEFYVRANSLTALNIQRYEEGWLYWQLQTGLELSKIKMGNLKNMEKFHSAKKQLLDMVSEDEWYDTFYSIDQIK